jgi:predicted Zn-dependent protease
MRWCGLLIGILVLRGQAPEPQQTWPVLSQRISQDLERRDGRLDDPAIVGYVQGIADRVARAGGGTTMEVRITRSSYRYANLLPDGVLYISGGLIESLANEAELAGLLAHQLAHQQPVVVAPNGRQTISLTLPRCELASPIRLSQFQREPERRATLDAIQTLRIAGYDPAAMLDLFSRLLNLRASFSDDTPPQGGYLLDSSLFVQARSNVEAAIDPVAAKTPPRLGFAPH